MLSSVETQIIRDQYVAQIKSIEHKHELDLFIKNELIATLEFQIEEMLAVSKQIDIETEERENTLRMATQGVLKLAEEEKERHVNQEAELFRKIRKLEADNEILTQTVKVLDDTLNHESIQYYRMYENFVAKIKKLEHHNKILINSDQLYKKGKTCENGDIWDFEI